MIKVSLSDRSVSNTHAYGTLLTHTFLGLPFQVGSFRGAFGGVFWEAIWGSYFRQRALKKGGRVIFGQIQASALEIS